MPTPTRTANVKATARKGKEKEGSKFAEAIQAEKLPAGEMGSAWVNAKGELVVLLANDPAGFRLAGPWRELIRAALRGHIARAE